MLTVTGNKRLAIVLLEVIKWSVLAAAELFTNLTLEKVNTLLILWLASEVAALAKNLNFISQTKNSGIKPSTCSVTDKN